MSHTPGPWRISSTDDGSVALVYSDGYDPYKAIRADRRLRRDERTDNAFLIAAAPTMLQMLRDIVADGHEGRIDAAEEWLRKFDQPGGEK